MHSSALGAAARIARRTFWSATRLSASRLARYSSIVRGFFATAIPPARTSARGPRCPPNTELSSEGRAILAIADLVCFNSLLDANSSVLNAYAVGYSLGKSTVRALGQ